MNAKVRDGIIRKGNGIVPMPKMYDFSIGLKCRRCHIQMTHEVEDGEIIVHCPQCGNTGKYRAVNINKWRNG